LLERVETAEHIGPVVGVSGDRESVEQRPAQDQRKE
jgi:hypothetical protein